MNSQAYIKLDERYGAHNYHPLDVVVERAEGVWLYDVDDNRYLDGLSAYSAVNQGHCHPRLIQAMQDQMHKVTLTSRAFRNDQMGHFLKTLCELMQYELALPMNTGAEAVETAIKAARKWGYQTKGVPTNQAEIIVFDGNFHGRTTTIVGFSSDEDSRADFGPFTPGFLSAPYGDLDGVKALITDNTVAILVEPIQGEAGVIIPPEGFLKGLEQLCRANNVLLIADEIQSGLGRSGKLLACDWEDVRPDLLILGKALSGGFYPVSAVLSDQPVLGLFQPGQHGSTYGGNPLGAAIACEALAILQDEQLVERSRELGDYAVAQLRTIKHPAINHIRAKGLFIGIVLNERARPYCEALQQRGLLCKETHENVIRFAPPLVISPEELEWAIEQFQTIFEEADMWDATLPAPEKPVLEVA
ncbi:MAG: ornithine--oxo-acid transaminase [Chloroflexota bacterium]